MIKHGSYKDFEINPGTLTNATDNLTTLNSTDA